MNSLLSRISQGLVSRFTIETNNKKFKIYGLDLSNEMVQDV